jgi:hypothetical protein
MSEGHSEERPPEGGGLPAEPEANPPPAADAPRQRNSSRAAALWLLGALILLVAGVALSPFWAPAVAPLLPWGAISGVSTEDYDALAARVAAVEKRATPPSVDTDAVKSAIAAVGRRVEQLETTVSARLSEFEKRPIPTSVDVDALKSAEGALVGRVDRLDQRLAGAEAQSSARAASEAVEIQKIDDELSRLGNVTGDLAKKLTELDQQLRSQAGTERTDAALAVVLLRIRDAIEQGRPFPAEYAALKGLARDPDLLAQAERLAEAAQNGVASHAVLSRRLTELAGRIATATEPVPQSDWGARALERLRGLVTIRRIDGNSQTGPEAAVRSAEAALARDDLDGAVAALDPLAGANAEAARPWLRMARERLAVETALGHLQRSLEARFGAPGAAPAEPSAKAKAPS